MSGEFGSYENGYFWYQMQLAANDCKKGDEKITQLWGDFLLEFSSVARAIAWCEAGDSGVDYPISETIARLPVLYERLHDIQNYLRPFEDVARQAVRDYVDKQSQKSSGK